MTNSNEIPNADCQRPNEKDTLSAAAKFRAYEIASSAQCYNSMLSRLRDEMLSMIRVVNPDISQDDVDDFIFVQCCAKVIDVEDFLASQSPIGNGK